MTTWQHTHTATAAATAAPLRTPNILTLKPKSETVKLNVEYNQLDPLLREGEGAGDVNDPDTGFSPYPGNINQLVFALAPYSKVCVPLQDPSLDSKTTKSPKIKSLFLH